MKRNYEALPESLRGGLRAYIEEGRPTGSFLRAVLGNDLKESFSRADIDNKDRLFEIVSWLSSNAPDRCWGSYEKVDEWIAKGGMGE